MQETFVFEGVKYRFEDIRESGRLLIQNLVFTNNMLVELDAQHALLMRAKNAYIADLKGEVIEKKSGVDLGALFMDD